MTTPLTEVIERQMERKQREGVDPDQETEASVPHSEPPEDQAGRHG
jgi:hypothetical protein